MSGLTDELRLGAPASDVPVESAHAAALGLAQRLTLSDAEAVPQAALPAAATVGPARAGASALSRVRPEAWLGLFVVVETVVLELWAVKTRYGLRVTADTPTYMSVLRDLALHPLQSPSSSYVSVAHVNVDHASPDMQLLALIWRWLGHGGYVQANLIDIIPAYELLAIKGILVTLLLFHALFVWARRQCGSPSTAWLALAALPAVWGPALIVSPGDLSLHGFMATADHSESLAIALMLYTLVALDGRLSVARLAVGTVGVAGVMATHPFTGVRLAALASALAAYDAARGGRKWMLTPPALALGFLAASLWPAYDLSQAMKLGGLDGRAMIAALAAFPLVGLGARAVLGRGRPRGLLALSLPEETPRLTLFLAVLGVAGVCFVAAREFWLYVHPDPFLNANRASIYWGGDSIPYWPFLLAPATAGFAGLLRLARRGSVLPLLWAAGCLAVGVAGAVGLPIPVSHRFLLFAQIPLALGVAVVVRDARLPLARRITAAALVASTALALGTLLFMPASVTYFRNPLQAGWSLNRLVPEATGTVIASDPVSEYFVLPLGDRMLTLTTWHVTDKSELPPTRRGYALIHRLYVGDRWRAAAREMWRLGVRYVVVNRGFTISAPTLDSFSSRSTPYIVDSWAQVDEVERYMARLGTIATESGSDREFHVYRLDAARLFGSRNVA